MTRSSLSAPFRRLTPWALAALALTVRAPAAPSDAAPALRIEAETGTRAGNVVIAHEGDGANATGFVTGFADDADRLTLNFAARAGTYEVTVRYRAPLKGFLCDVNGLTLTGKFSDSQGKFVDLRFGKVELRDGENTVAIHGGWKGYEIDRVDFASVPALPALPKPPATLTDPDATPAARALMSYLVEHYGERTLSGTIEGADVDYVRETTGQLPAILAGDLLNVTTTSIRFMGVTSGETDKMIERAKQGHIVTYCWHWRPPTGVLDKVVTLPDGTTKNARWYMSFYTWATTFDVERVLAHPESPDYALLLTDIDMVAGELRKFSDWGIPVLWRPLHESEGEWFWWGAKGPKPFIQLWRLLHDRFTRVHGLHNLIWVYTGTANREWYPGDDVVDIVGIDEYPTDVRDPLSATWDAVQASFGGKKLIALSEFGGAPDLERARRLGVRWSYFASWNKELGPMKVAKPDLQRIYNDPRVINLRDLPKDRWKPFDRPVLRD